MEESGNCILVRSKTGNLRYTACVVQATRQLDLTAIPAGWSKRDGSLEVIDTDEGDDTVRVAARGALLPGLPVRSSDRGEAVPSTCAL